MERAVRFLVLGGPVPRTLAGEIAGTLELCEEGALALEDADGLLLHVVPDVLPVLRRFRAGGGSLPIYGWSPEVVDIRARLSWIREGADDLLSGPDSAEMLVRRVRGKGQRLTRSPDIGLRIDRYLRSIVRYLQAREQLVGVLGDGGRGRFVDCTFLRDQVLRVADDAPPDAFGQRRAGDREPISWPIALVDPVGTAQILNIGADGMCVALFQAPARGVVLRGNVEGVAVRAQLDLEVRWHRRVARERWEAGVLATACRLLGSG